MPSAALDDIVHAVLYEGHILYPYRPSSRKNQRERFTFGRVYPEDYSRLHAGAEPCRSQTECLLWRRAEAAKVEVTARFLHPMWREIGRLTNQDAASFEPASALTVKGELHQTWQEATEREAGVAVELSGKPSESHIQFPFSFPGLLQLENLTNDAAIRRRQEPLEGMIEIAVVVLSEELLKIRVVIFNRTPIAAAQCDDADSLIMRTFASTHVVLRASGGEFISLLDPPAGIGAFAEQCVNIGVWPVLVGDQALSRRDILLSSPIILYDYPQIASGSAGAFFDATEIEEMLALRVMTLSDSEKIEMRRTGETTCQILERAESTGAPELLKMHATMRPVPDIDDFFNPTKPVDNVLVEGRVLRTGSRVRIRPKRSADAMDMILAGKIAEIQAIEQDTEGRLHLALVLEDDPGKDLGQARQTGHRFFYGAEEVEPL
jgi:hypothetical protein